MPASLSPDDVTRFDRIEYFLNFLYAERRRLAFGPRKLWCLDLAGRIDGQNAFFSQPGKQHPDRGHVLLDGRS